MATAVTMPMLGLTMEEGAVAEWLKHEGEEVRKDEPLFTVEMDKGIVEVPSPASGVLLRVRVPVGQVVPVKTVIAEIGVPGETLADVPLPPPRERSGEGAPVQHLAGIAWPSAAPAGRLFASPRARMRARERSIEIADVTGSGPNGRIVEDDVLAFAAVAPSDGRVAATPI